MKKAKLKSGMVDYLVGDLLAGVDGIRFRAMFGGYGLYREDVFFGIIADEELYFKTDETSCADYKRAASEPFTYKVSGRKKPVVMSYWKVPAAILEDREALLQWAETALQIAAKKKTTIARRKESLKGTR